MQRTHLEAYKESVSATGCPDFNRQADNGFFTAIKAIIWNTVGAVWQEVTIVME